MSVQEPTSEEATAAIAKARAAATAVRNSDRHFELTLLISAVGYLAVMGGASWFRVGPFFVWLACMPMAVVVAALRSWQRSVQLAFTTRAKVAFYVATVSFAVWNAVLISWALATGWLGVRAGPHLFAIAVASVVPLLAGIGYIRWRR